ncbi:MAG: transposase [Chloroflexi bacterium]|nr:transposase [Chloroflexota bacterium]
MVSSVSRQTSAERDRGARRPPHVDLDRAVYFVSTRIAESRRLFVGDAGKAAVGQLLADRDRYGFLLFAYAFMPDHAHFVLVPAEGHTISSTMRIVKGGIARRVNQLTGAKGTIWQEGFYDKVAHTIDQLNAYIEYTHRNPVTAGIVSRERDYALSSAEGSCLRDYQRFLNEPFEPQSDSARAFQPAPRDGR